MTPVVLVMPWPVMRELSPNWRGHWTKKANAKKAMRAEWGFQALAQGMRRLDATALHLAIEFVPPDRRPRDLDNLLAQIKAGLDGLADVLQVDDGRWSLSIAKSTELGGYVRITVSAPTLTAAAPASKVPCFSAAPR